MNWWERDPRYGKPGWTVIHDEGGTRFVQTEPRKRRRKARPLRFPDPQVGDVLVHRTKCRRMVYPKHPAGLLVANEDERIITTEAAAFWVITHRWFDPVQGFDDPTAGQMVGATPVNHNGLVGFRPYPWTLRGLAKEGFWPASPDQTERVRAFCEERRQLLAAFEAGELTADEARIRALPYRELIRDLAA